MLPSTRVEPRTHQHVDPGAENPIVPSPAMDKPTPSSTPNDKAPFFRYDVDFVVTNCKDAAQLLSEFLRALIKMDKDSSVLLSNSTSEDQQIDATTIFPAGNSKDPSKLAAFVQRYIGDLRPSKSSQSSMLGRIRVRTHFKFAALNQNKDVIVFLRGEWSGSKGTRVRLRLNTLGCIRYPVGFLLNTVTRHDMVESLFQRITGWLDNSKEVSSKDFPPFQVEVLTMYREKAAANYYQILTVSKGDVETVAQALLKHFPKPSEEISFVPSTTWGAVAFGPQELFPINSHAVPGGSFVVSTTGSQRLLGGNHNGTNLRRKDFSL
jgi:hypothetical protein